jgi:uncharacterized protein HemX
MFDIINSQIRELKANFKLALAVIMVVILIGLAVYLIWPKAEEEVTVDIPEGGKTLEEIQEALRQMASQNGSPLTMEEEAKIKEDLKQMTSTEELSEEERQQAEENLRQMMPQ